MREFFSVVFEGLDHEGKLLNFTTESRMASTPHRIQKVAPLVWEPA